MPAPIRASDAPLPTGTVTFLFTDIEGSTRLWEAQPDAMRVALARHDALCATPSSMRNGHVFKTVGDAFCAAFALAPDAVAAALAAQRALAAEPWPEATPIKVRMALHTGAVELRDGDYFGPPLNRVARLLATGHGGQTLALADHLRALPRLAARRRVAARPGRASAARTWRGRSRCTSSRTPTCRGDFPPLKSLSTHPNNLPQQLTSFIGREKEIAEVEALLARTRLLTLTGAGGSGKTRLACRSLPTRSTQFPDGVWLVELAPLADPGSCRRRWRWCWA